MSKVEVEGLNRQQRLLADILWTCNSREQCYSFIRSLPRLQQQRDAVVVMELMQLSVIDMIDTVEPEVVQYLNTLRRTQ